MHFVLFTGGILVKGIATEKILRKFDKIIAIDSGALRCMEQNLTPDFVVGDLDSIDKKTLKEFEKAGSKILKFPNEKDETDTEIGIDIAIKNGATQISILGGVSGNRIDHVLSNILLLLKKKYADTQIKFVNGNQEIYLGRKNVRISGTKGDVISLIPLEGSINNIKSTGLKYDLAKYVLSVQGNHGISNILTNATANVTFKKGALLFIHTLTS